MKPRRFRLSYLVWVLIPLIAYGGSALYGLPHMIWSYSWIDQGQGYDPFAARHYTHCTFIGPYGAFHEHARDGRCAWVRFYHEPARPYAFGER